MVIWVILIDFVLGRTDKAMGEHGIKSESTILLKLDYGDNLGLLDENVIKFIQVHVHGTKMSLKTKYKED